MSDAKVLNNGLGLEIRLPKTINENYSLPDPSLLQIYKDRENRVIWMLGEIGDEVYDWVDFILDVNREDKNIPIEKRKPIKCIIANEGGRADPAYTLVDIITLSKTPIHGIAIGVCASAASMIYLACHKRYALPKATFIFHQGSCSNLGGTFNQLNSFMEDYKRDIEQLTEFYKKHTIYEPDLIDKKLAAGDWYIYVPEAIKNGVVDEIIEDIDIIC